MPTEVWFRNPNLYHRECAELHVNRIVWDHGLLKKKGIGVNRFMDLFFGVNSGWTTLIISELGALQVDTECSMEQPRAVYPVWKYGEDFRDLVDLVKNPVGLNERLCRGSGDPQWRPKLGQPHRVVISYCPDGRTGHGKEFFRILSELQEENPECIIHLHGIYSFTLMFGLTFGAVDYEPRADAAKGKLVLPAGKRVQWDDEEAGEYSYWYELVGCNLRDMSVPRNRCLFNMLSAQWAGKHFQDNVRFRTRGFEGVDPDNSSALSKLKKERQSAPRIFLRNVKPLADDKFYCNACSLSSSCRYYREGAVCAVPDSEPAQLVDFFQTRSADKIMTGLMKLAEMEAERISAVRQKETDTESISPELTKMMNNLFNHGEKLAKLFDPSLRSAPTPGALPAGVAGALPTGTTAQAATAQIMEYLLTTGMERADITPELVYAILEAPGATLQDKVMEAGAALRALEA
jgi:hypothetical protein